MLQLLQLEKLVDEDGIDRLADDCQSTQSDEEPDHLTAGVNCLGESGSDEKLFQDFINLPPLT